MLTIEKLSKKPVLFRSFTGMSLEDFQVLSNRMKDSQPEYEKKRLTQPNRERALGGGRKFNHCLEDQLLMLLMYYRLYITYALLGFLFNLDQSNIQRNIAYIQPLFKQFLPIPKRMLERDKKVQTFEELLLLYPQLRVVVDATEQAIPRPSDKEEQRCCYSGKKKRHTVKSQVTANKQKIIVDVFSGAKGSRHDFMILQDSEIDKKLPDLIGVEGDRGYQGMKTVLPGRTCYLPFKAERNQPLTELQKWTNKLINRSRVMGEHVISWLKKFRILKEIFRNELSKYPEVFEMIAGIVNLRTLNRLGIQW